MPQTNEVMASLIKRGNRFYGQWSDASRTPKTRRLSLNEPKRAAARRLLEKIDARYRAGEYDPWLQGINEALGRPAVVLSLEGAVGRFLKEKERTLAQDTMVGYRSVMGMLCDQLGSHALQGIRPEDFHRMIDGWSVGRNTVAQRYRVMRVFFNWSVRQGLVPESPLALVNPPRKSPAPLRIVRWEEVRAICTEIDKPTGVTRA